jgi:outer membrane protein assembly factor BamB
MIPIRFSLVAAVGITLGALAAAQDWPEFRGPTGQGIVTGGKIPTEWSDTKNVVWKQAIPGTGWSSPIVWKGRIYLTTAVPAKDKGKDDQSLRALSLDAKNGKVLWDKELFYQEGGKTDAIHEKASHANPTPITDGHRVYFHFGPHGSAALDLDGKVLWRNADLKYRPWHGNGGSPVVVDDLLIFNCDGEEVQYVVALDRAIGKVVWKADRKVEAEYKNSYCTPLLIEVKGQRQIVSPAAGAVMAYEPKTGKELWRVRLDDGYSNVPRPVAGHGLVFLSNSTDTPHLMAIRPDGKGDVTNTHIAWTQKKAVPLTSSPLLAGDELYMISDSGIATCMDARTGQVHWRERIGGNHSASPLLADGKVYFQNEEGIGTIIKTGKKFEVLARNNIGERVLASYAVSDGALFIRTEHSLYRIESR